MNVAPSTDISSLRAFDIVMIILPSIAIALRFWSRTLAVDSKSIRFWWDDWTILATLPLSIAGCALQITALELGLGQHLKTLSPQRSMQLFKVLWASYYMSDAGIALSKASVLLFYTRVFSMRTWWFRSGIWIAHTLNILWYFSSIARCLLYCDPVDKYWDHEKPGFCRHGGALYIGSSVPSVAIDIFVLLLPLPMIAGLSMRLDRKILIAGFFICGYLVVAISLGRMITSLVEQNHLDEDVTYYGLKLFFWVAAEPAVSIIGCCLPIIFKLARQCISRGPSSVFSTKKSSNSSNPQQTTWPKKTYYGRSRAEQSFELTDRDILTDAAPVGYAVTATKIDADSRTDIENGPMMDGVSGASTIMVHKGIHVGSYGRL